MNCKAKGSRNERRSRDFLKEKGYTVIKAGASLGEFDLVAWDSLNILFIQVKTEAWPRPAERLAMEKVIIPPNGVKLVHRWNSRQSNPLVRELEDF